MAGGGAATRGSQRGSVTAETALALPSVVIAIALVACVGQVVGGQVRCEDAARAAARLAARGESLDRVRSAAESAGPAGAVVQVDRSGELVTVRVLARLPLALPGHPEITVDASATADAELPPSSGAGAAS